MNKISLIFFLCILVALIIVAGGISIHHNIHNSALTLDTYLSMLDYHIAADNWNNVTNEFIRVDKSWNNIKNKWVILINSSDIDEISNAIVKLDKYIKTKEKSETLVEISLLREMLMSLVEKNKFNIKNIL